MQEIKVELRYVLYTGYETRHEVLATSVANINYYMQRGTWSTAGYVPQELASAKLVE